jgi:hypothetical protein
MSKHVICGGFTTLFIEPRVEVDPVFGLCCDGETPSHFHVYMDGKHIASRSAVMWTWVSR